MSKWRIEQEIARRRAVEAEVKRLGEHIRRYREAIHRALEMMEDSNDRELGEGGVARKAFAHLWHEYYAIPAGIPSTRCKAMLHHGPGHMSKTRCELTGSHDVHETHYNGGQQARWRDGQYTDKLRAEGIEFDSESYPENMAMTGFSDEPPEEET